MKWFKHFSNAHNDNALNKIRMRFGADGYAIYWYCLELIAGDLEGENANFELSHDAEVIGFNLKVDQLRVEEIMRYMVDLKLFEQSGSTITCLKIAKFLDKKTTRNKDIHSIIDKFNEIETVADKSGLVADKMKHSALEEKRREEKRIKDIYTPPIPTELLNDFLKVRRAKKTGELTKTAFQGIEKEAAKANLSAKEAIEICCARGWAGFNAEWLGKLTQAETPEWKKGLV